MVRPGDIVDHHEMWRIEGFSVQKGMNYRPRGRPSIFLMSRRKGAPYDDLLSDEGRTLVYVGHDDHAREGGPDPATLDQPMTKEDGRPSDNAKFLAAVDRTKAGAPPELVRVWEKIKTGVWSFNGVFELKDAWKEHDGVRNVFKFQLKVVDAEASAPRPLAHTRVIPSKVKAEVWKRDQGKCVECGATDNLHFDHDLPFAKGGTSLLAANVKILCARHNLEKSDRIG